MSQKTARVASLAESGMSALGQKQTFAVQDVMSALPPKADMCGALAHVRFVPEADIHRTSCASVALASHLNSRCLGHLRGDFSTPFLCQASGQSVGYQCSSF
jgi:hypothetical protein